MNQLINAGINIQAPAHDVWRIITDTETWPEWGPSVRSVRCRDRFITSGSKGYVQTALGLWVPFEITESIFEKKWTWRIYHMQMTGHRIKRISNNQCRLVFEIPLFIAPYWFICAIAVRRIRHLAEQDFKRRYK